MHIRITGRHVTVTSALKQYVEARVAKLDRYGLPVKSLQVILGIEKYRHVAEAVVALNGAVVQAKASTKEMYSAIDEVMDKIDHQLSKRKDKRVERKGSKWSEMQPGQLSVEGAAVDVKTIRVIAPVLTVEEAVARLSSRVSSLVVFRAAKSGRIQVLVRSTNGGAELLDPQSP